MLNKYELMKIAQLDIAVEALLDARDALQNAPVQTETVICVAVNLDHALISIDKILKDRS